MARFLGTIAFVLVLFSSMLVWPASVSADDAQNINTYRGYINAINRGDAAAALAAFADDAQLSGIPPGCLTPCNGRAAIQAQLNLEVTALHLQLQLLSSIQVSNGVVTAQVAHRADPLRQAGLSRVLTRDTVTFKGDKISKFVVEFDTTDKQTAARVALLSAPAPTAVAPAPAAAPVISPPSTGDAGLLAPTQASRLRSLFVPAAVLGAALTLGGLSVRLRRRTA